MKAAIPAFFSLCILLCGCSSRIKPRPEDTIAKAPWSYSQEGLIVSGVQPNDLRTTSETIEGVTYFTTTLTYPGKEVSDPLEGMREFRGAFIEASRLAEIKAQAYGNRLGAIHVFWSEKKQILKEKYRIDWKTPAELNPNICYD